MGKVKTTVTLWEKQSSIPRLLLSNAILIQELNLCKLQRIAPLNPLQQTRHGDDKNALGTSK